MSDMTSVDVGGQRRGGFGASVGRAIRVLFSPSQVYGELEKRPEWLAPLLICVLIAVLSSAILIPSVIGPQQVEQLEQRGLTEEQMEAARPWVEGNRILVMGIVMAAIGTPIVLLIAGLVLHLVCAVILGGQANFVRTFSVITFAWMVSLPESIIKVPISLATKTAEVQTSLALLMTRDASAGFWHRFLYSFLNHVDIFTVWRILLVGLGVSVMFRFSRQKSYYAVVGLWLVVAVLLSVLGAVMPTPVR